MTSQVPSRVTYANGATQSLTYDLAGNVISETDGEGNTKRYRYDRVNRLTAVIDEEGETLLKVVLSEDGGMLSAYPIN